MLQAFPAATRKKRPYTHITKNMRRPRWELPCQHKSHSVQHFQNYAQGRRFAQTWPYQERPNLKTPITCIQICLFSHTPITKYSFKGNRNPTEVWWGLCTESFWGEIVRTLHTVRLKKSKIQTGAHKPRDFLCCIWLLASFKVNMIKKSHCLHRDFSKFPHSHKTKTGKSVIYRSLTVYSEYNKFQ